MRIDNLESIYLTILKAAHTARPYCFYPSFRGPIHSGLHDADDSLCSSLHQRRIKENARFLKLYFTDISD